MTVLELINSSRRLIGNSKPGRGVIATHSEAVDALWILNAMLDSWSTESLTVFYVPRNVYDLTINQGEYTIGSGGDFGAARPIKITRAGIIRSDVTEETEQPIGVTDSAGWSRITRKTQTSDIPLVIYPDNAYPLTTIHVWPVPTLEHQLVLYPWEKLSSFAATTDTFTMPPGYLDAIRYNLATRMAPEWGLPLRDDVLHFAREAKAKIKALNIPSMEMSVDLALIGRGNTGITWSSVVREFTLEFTEEFG